MPRNVELPVAEICPSFFFFFLFRGLFNFIFGWYFLGKMDLSLHFELENNARKCTCREIEIVHILCLSNVEFLHTMHNPLSNSLKRQQVCTTPIIIMSYFFKARILFGSWIFISSGIISKRVLSPSREKL